MVGPGGLEPPTPRLSSVCSNQLSYEPEQIFNRPELLRELDDVHYKIGGADQTRTDDSLRARQVLFQLSYGPANFLEQAGSVN